MAVCSILLNLIFAFVVIAQIVDILAFFHATGLFVNKDIPETIAVYSFALLSTSSTYVCIIFAYLYQARDRGGFFKLPTFNQKRALVTYSSLSIVWLILFVFSMFFAWKWFVGIGYFLLINGIVTAIVPICIYYEKHITVGPLVNKGCVMETTIQLTPKSAIHASPSERELQQEQSILQLLNWQDYKVVEDKFKALQLDDFYQLQKWMHEMRKASDLGLDCSTFRRIHNEMSQRCFDYNLKVNERQALRDLAEQKSENVNADDCLITQRGTRPQEPPPYNDMTIKLDMAGRPIVERTSRPIQPMPYNDLRIDMSGRPFFDD